MAEIDNLEGKLTLDGSDFSASIAKLSDMVLNFGKMVGLGFGIGAVVDFGKASVDAASKAQQAEVLFAQALGTVGISYDSVNSSAQSYFEQLQKTTGFQKDELESSTTRLIQMTQNYADSLKLVGIASDFARGTGKSLEEATMLVGRAYEGQTMALRRAGVAVSTHTSAVEALRIVQQRFAGDASAFMDTYAGHVEKLKNQWHDFEISFGKILIPVLETLGEIFKAVFDGIKNQFYALLLASMEVAEFLRTHLPGASKIFKTSLSSDIEEMKVKFHNSVLDMQKDFAALFTPIKSFDDATKKVAEHVNDMANNGRASIDKFGETLESVGTDFLMSFGKSFSSAFQIFEKGTVDMQKAFEKALDQMVQKLLDSAILNFISLFLPLPGGAQSFGILGQLFPGSKLQGSAHGNAFSGGSIIPFASGGFIPGPMTFPMAGGNVGMAGEAGPEAIVPLTRTSSGDLGIKSDGGQMVQVAVYLDSKPILQSVSKASRTGQVVIHPTAVRP